MLGIDLTLEILHRITGKKKISTLMEPTVYKERQTRNK